MAYKIIIRYEVRSSNVVETPGSFDSAQLPNT